MSENIILSGSIPGFEYQIFKIGSELLHRVKLIGPAGFKERKVLYDVLLELNDSQNFFCIQDNQAGYPNNLSIEAMKYFNELLNQRGVKHFYSVLVTRDEWFDHITNIATLNLAEYDMDGKIISTTRIKEAEKFIGSVMAMRKKIEAKEKKLSA